MRQKDIWFIIGLFLISEGVGSLAVFVGQPLLFQFGRLLRVIIGALIIVRSEDF